MNVYEEAHKLAAAIKESGEYKEFDELKKEVDKDPDLAQFPKGFSAEAIPVPGQTNVRRSSG